MMAHEELKRYPVYFLALVVMAVVAWCFAPVMGAVHWGIGIAGAVMLCLVAVLLHVQAGRMRKRDAVVRERWRVVLYAASYFINAVCSGHVIGTLYAHLGWAPDLGTLLWALVPAAVLALVFCVGYMVQGKLWHRIWGVIIISVSVAALALSVITWVKWDRYLGSFAFFSCVFMLFFLIACLCSRKEPENRWRFLSFSGFWAFAVIAVVVVLVLSEGEFLDGLDFDFGGNGKKKKNKMVK